MKCDKQNANRKIGLGLAIGAGIAQRGRCIWANHVHLTYRHCDGNIDWT